MKHIGIVVLSLAAAAFGRPAGYCTANTQAEDIAALQKQNAELQKQLTKLTDAQADTSKLTNQLEGIRKENETLKGRLTELSKAPDDIANLHRQLDQIREENEALQEQLDDLSKPHSREVAEDNSSTGLLIRGAGVSPEDVNWRIRAGLSPAQAVEVALNEKREADAAR